MTSTTKILLVRLNLFFIIILFLLHNKFVNDVKLELKSQRRTQKGI